VSRRRVGKREEWQEVGQEKGQEVRRLMRRWNEEEWEEK
jgi:hypothetical protein